MMPLSSLRTELARRYSRALTALIFGVGLFNLIIVFCFQYAHHRNNFENQIASWERSFPESIIVNLVDSDYMPIDSKLRLLKKTEIFSSFVVMDASGNLISRFGESFDPKESTPIKDDTGTIWGAFAFEANKNYVWKPFVESAFISFLIFLLSLGLIFYLVQNTLLSRLISMIEKNHREIAESKIHIEKQRAAAKVSSQVAHDIRSPLTALDLVINAEGSSALPENLRVIVRSAVGRIRNIADDLIKAHPKGALDKGKSTETTQLFALIRDIVAEKWVEYRGHGKLEIIGLPGKNTYQLFSKINASELKRVLSNVINNSVEAVDPNRKGMVVISLREEDDYCVLSVKDNGKGMPKDVLAKVGVEECTFGKDSGTGLGLLHAKNTMEKWGGFLKFRSRLGHGTTVDLYVPKTEAPTWFLKTLKISPGGRVVVLDDDESIHQIWNDRLRHASEKGVRIRDFLSPPELGKWMSQENGHAKDDTVFLVDYEYMGFEENGIDVIQSHNLQDRSILVTSRYGDPVIAQKCRESGIHLLPKNMAPFIPIEL